MPRFTYDQFLNEARNSGLLGEFSQADLQQAQRNPDFGMSILTEKRNYHSATTQEGRDAANQRAEQLRSSWGNYTGGQNGNQFTLDLMSPSSFTYEEAPTYTSRYDDQIQSMISDLLARPDFSYDPDADPLFQQYRQQYTREGNRAAADALGTAAAATGGIPSSYASTAAGQAANYYSSQLMDRLPELYDLAYNQYLNEYQMDLSDLGVVQGQEQTDYNRYLNSLNQYNNDRNFAYGVFSDELASQQQERADALQEALYRAEYGDYAGIADRGWDVSNIPAEREWQQYLDELNYSRGQQDQSFAQDQVDAILAAGGVPSQDMIAASGYSDEYVNALRRAYLQNLYASRSGSGRSSGRSSSGSGSGSGGSSGESGTTGNVYDRMYQAGVRTYDDAYAWLRANDYGTTDANRYASGLVNKIEAGDFDSGNRASRLSENAQTVYKNLTGVPGSSLEDTAKINLIRAAYQNGRISESEADTLMEILNLA